MTDRQAAQLRRLQEAVQQFYLDVVLAAPKWDDGEERELVIRAGVVGYDDNNETLFTVALSTTTHETV